MTGRRGFTLLEMIVATTIMGVAVVGLLAGISGATRNASRLRDYARVTQLARQQMNELLTDYTLPHNTVLSNTFNPEVTGGLECGWRAQVTTVEKSPAPRVGEPALDRIELEVSWNSAGQRKSFSMEAFRRRNLTAADLPPAGAQ